MNVARSGLVWLAASILYLLALYVPGIGLTLAPVMVAIVVGLSKMTPRSSMAIALLSALTGYAIALGLTGGLEGVSLITGIGGGLVFLVTVFYHLVTPTLLTYVVTSFTYKK